MKNMIRSVVCAVAISTSIARASDVSLVVDSAGVVGDPVVYFGPPNNFCSPSRGEGINDHYRLSSIENEFSILKNLLAGLAILAVIGVVFEYLIRRRPQQAQGEEGD